MKSTKSDIFILSFFLIFISVFYGCQDNFLDLKRDKKQVVPSSLKDYQAMLDNTAIFNSDASTRLAVISSDNYFLTRDRWTALSSAEERNGYIWAKDIFEGIESPDWNQAYQRILYANLVLEGLEKYEPSVKEKTEWNNLRGSALFYRAWAFYQLVQLFSNTYDPITAKTDLGIPLRLESNINITPERATVEKTYLQIRTDLEMAARVLNNSTSYKTRPFKASAFGLLARVSLQMEDYNNAVLYADSCLQYYNKLIDYNTIDSKLNFPFERFNDEVIFHDAMRQITSIIPPRLNVDSNLFKMYRENDLRKSSWFYYQNEVLSYKGSYNGSNAMFVGLAVDEIYLILAECNARTENITQAAHYINELLKHRYNKATFEEIAIRDKKSLLNLILQERRKELVFRGVRWSDLKRLNRDPEYQTTLVRNLEDEVYELKPNESRYIFPIPDIVVQMSNVEQNAR